jgi:hypothetical protein
MRMRSRALWGAATALSGLLTGGLVLVATANEKSDLQPPIASRTLDAGSALGAHADPRTDDERLSEAPSDEGRTVHLIGEVNSDKIVAREGPSAQAKGIATFGRLNEQGAPQVFLLQPQETDAQGLLPEGTTWVKALLPLRPNGTSGYLEVEDLLIRNTSYRLVIDTSAFNLKLYEGDSLVMRVPVGIGTGSTPTPIGDFYLASLLKPPDPNSVYGTYAYGLSGYSETLLDWKGGGVIGLHGTNHPGSLGRAVSHGCIRMRNSNIEKLVPLLPLGTPIQIK